MKLRFAIQLFVAVVFAVPSFLSAQDVPSVAPTPAIATKPAVPSGGSVDPVALLSLAREKNGLASAAVRPWHIRATYTTFDQNGKPKDHGSYEEWWLSPTKYKRMYTGPKYTQTDYATGNGLYRDGSQDWRVGVLAILRSALIDPLPSIEVLKGFTLQQFDIASGPAKLRCVRLGFELPPNTVVPDDYFPTFFFAKAAPALRIFAVNSFQTTYDQIVIFQGYYVARELHIALNKKPLFDVEVQTVEALKETTDDILVPAKSAVAVNLAEPINLG